MVFGYPVAVVAELLAAFGEGGAVGDGIGGALAAADGRLIEDAESNGQGNLLAGCLIWPIGDLS